METLNRPKYDADYDTKNLIVMQKVFGPLQLLKLDRILIFNCFLAIISGDGSDVK